MPPSLFRQETQVEATDVFNDTVAAGATMESGAVNLEDDLNNLRSQLLRYTGETNWYDDISGRTVKLLGTDLADIEGKPLLFRAQLLTDIAVPATQNYVVLTVASSEAPSQVAAVGAASTEGAIVAFHSGTFGTHSLDEVTGQNAIQPKNLLIIRDAASGNPIPSGGKDIFGLLQSESNTNGHTFDDATNQVQISFVRQNANADDLEACPVADIDGESINYSYVQRVFLDNIPEYAFLSGGWVDQSAAVDVTLDNAIDNQSGPATQQQNIQWRIDDANTLDFQDSTGGTNLLRIAPNVAGDEIEVNVDILDINVTQDVDINDGILVDTGGTQISIGSTAGTIASAGGLSLESGGASDLTIDSANEILLDDVNKGGSTYAGSFKLSETATEWSNFETEFGEVSLLNALVQANQPDTTRVRTYGTATTTINAGVNVTGGGGSPNLDTQLTDYSGMTFITDVDIYINGQLQVNAAAATEDVYPGAVPANGDFYSTRKIKTGDKIIMITWG